ncbi:predicted protein [Streptomyces pristinaespiralis ATCC 25486]|uniref:Predicted protein n=1 Tax=Streptomyces pristinaespiralis (strain ATCC 25486 / DSM 40338 / CBS 914.69 / JCM 4507 / KCC S-0507 / NBRC 13074 / NRRL 2958 / 5647) TaxID=457429 RepID=D6X9V6_STRE2|nr:predicted protein [Streptomyces pristinaespiralis ATCC 25486]
MAVLFGAFAKREDGAEKKDLTFGLAIGGSVVAAGIAATWALSEHASTGIQPSVAMPVDVLHLLAVAVWLGGLATLLTALYRSAAVERRAVRRFSTVAFVSVVVLAATGLYQSWRQVGSWSALTGTTYGQLLLLKVGLVAVMVGVAWISRRWTAQLAEVAEAEGATEVAGAEEAEEAEEKDKDAGTSVDPAREAQLARQKAAVATAERKRNRDADHERSGLRRSVLAETGVAVVLLAVTTVLTSTEPGRTEETAKAGNAQAAPAAPAGPTEIRMPFDTGGPKGKGTVRLTLDPALSGANDMHVWIESPDGKALDAPEVKISFTLKAKEIGPLPITPDRITAGHWTASAVQIPMPGDWQVKVTVRTSDIDQTTIDKNIKIG